MRPKELVDLVLELAQLREMVEAYTSAPKEVELDAEVELAAARCMVAYRLLGGKLLNSRSAWRARARALLSTGNEAAA